LKEWVKRIQHEWKVIGKDLPGKGQYLYGLFAEDVSHIIKF
jgi:hypothetical protein